jgi:hypothetical protein
MTHETEDKVRAFVQRFAEMKTCAEDRASCEMESGPSCAVHDRFVDEQVIQAARSLIASLQTSHNQ